MEFNSPSTVNLVCLNIYNTVQLKIETSIYCVGGAPTRKSAAVVARRCPKIGGGGATKKSAAAARRDRCRALRKWPRPRRDRDICLPRPRRDRDVDSFSRDETETRRWYVSRQDVETEITTLLTSICADILSADILSTLTLARPNPNCKFNSDHMTFTTPVLLC